MSDLTAVIPLESENTFMEKKVLRWKITLKNRLYFRSPVFAPMKVVDANFYFEVWFQRLKKGPKPEVSLQVILKKLSESSDHSDLRFEFSVSVHYSNGVPYKEYKSDKPIYFKDFTERLCIDDICNACQLPRLLVHDHKVCYNYLTLKCKVIFSGHIISPTSYLNNMDALHDLQQFNKNFESLYQSNELSDVSIQVGEQTLKSHKFVLAAHSPVFKRMLLQDFQEAKTGVITISDSQPEIFGRFLKFLYTGQVVDESFADVVQLYTLADKYDVQTLKRKCLKMLTYCSMNEDQIDDVLRLAYQYNDDDLIKAAKQMLPTTTNKVVLGVW